MASPETQTPRRSSSEYQTRAKHVVGHAIARFFPVPADEAAIDIFPPLAARYSAIAQPIDTTSVSTSHAAAKPMARCRERTTA